MNYRMLIAGASLTVLAACGGGGGNLGHPVSLAQISSDYQRIATNSNGVPVIAPPATGTATFDGMMILAEDLIAPGPSDPGYAGSVSLTANFGGATPNISGTGKNFYFATLGPGGYPVQPAKAMAGSLAITASLAPGAIGGDNKFDVDLDGDLDLDANGSLDTVVNGTIRGEFNSTTSNPTYFRAVGDSMPVSNGAGLPDTLDVLIFTERN